MPQIDYVLIERLHASARRERAREVYRLFCRAAVWIATRLSGGNATDRSAACCPSPA